MDSQERFLSGYDSRTFRGTLNNENGQKAPQTGYYHYVHIPKTGGDSLMADSPNFMPKGTILKGNNEYGYLASKKHFANVDGHFSVAFLRDPVLHVVSQFLECKYDPYFRQFGAETNFPGLNAKKDALQGFDEWIQHFFDAGLEKHLFDPEFAYKCYDPWNMQARYLTSPSERFQAQHFAETQNDREPDLETAVRHINELDVLGITDYFPASLCVFEFHALGSKDLGKNCRFCDPETHSLSLVQENIHHIAHYSPKYTLDMVSNETLSLIKQMTTVDHQLYSAGLDRFFKDLERIRLSTGVDLLCREDNTTGTNAAANDSTDDVDDKGTFVLNETDTKEPPQLQEYNESKSTTHESINYAGNTPMLDSQGSRAESNQTTIGTRGYSNLTAPPPAVEEIVIVNNSTGNIRLEEIPLWMAVPVVLLISLLYASRLGYCRGAKVKPRLDIETASPS